MSTTALYADPAVKQHDTGPGHPETAARIEAVLSGLAALRPRLLELPRREATLDELALCHTREYIHLVEREVNSGLDTLSTGDTTIGARSFAAALTAAGGVLQAVDAVMERRASNAFCAVRPPGHHATRSRGMGFCLFNNVAIGALYARHQFGARRVLIADWDVHHGNGTQEIFYSDGAALFFSTHQWPWYPGTGAASETGEGSGAGLILNRPLPAGSGRSEILGSFETDLLPAARTFQPDLVLISAGFDSRAGDPLGRFLLDDGDFADLTRLLRGIADECCEGRVVSVLEGGYSLAGLEAAAAAHVGALLE